VTQEKCFCSSALGDPETETWQSYWRDQEERAKSLMRRSYLVDLIPAANDGLGLARSPHGKSLAELCPATKQGATNRNRVVARWVRSAAPALLHVRPDVGLWSLLLVGAARRTNWFERPR